MMAIPAVLMWGLWFALQIPLFILGLILIPIALWCDAAHTVDSLIHFTWKWMWLWDNAEDGICPVWYERAHPTWGPIRLAFTWSAIRNSVNNLQRVKWLNCKPQFTASGAGWMLSVNKAGTNAWIRQGIYAGGQLTLLGKTFNYGYGFIPWEVTYQRMPLGDTRDIPYISQHWG